MVHDGGRVGLNFIPISPRFDLIEALLTSVCGGVVGRYSALHCNVERICFSSCGVSKALNSSRPPGCVLA